ncbi:MAG: hypothetical protein ACI89L_000013 [Phycisphaerales bacterium]|jgi:hypothetical protein
MTTSSTNRTNQDLHESLGRFAANAARIAAMETLGSITPEQAARQIGQLYFELSTAAARFGSR